MFSWDPGRRGPASEPSLLPWLSSPPSRRAAPCLRACALFSLQLSGSHTSPGGGAVSPSRGVFFRPCTADPKLPSLTQQRLGGVLGVSAERSLHLSLPYSDSRRRRCAGAAPARNSLFLEDRGKEGACVLSLPRTYLRVTFQKSKLALRSPNCHSPQSSAQDRPSTTLQEENKCVAS